MFVNIESLGWVRAQLGVRKMARLIDRHIVSRRNRQALKIDKILFYYYLYLSIFVLGFWLCFVYTNKEGTKSGLLESSDASPTKKELHTLITTRSTVVIVKALM